MYMRKLSCILISIAACFSCTSFSFAETADTDAEYIDVDTDRKTEYTHRLNLSFIPYELPGSIVEYNLYKFKERDDLLDYISNPYISTLSKSLDKESLYSYALSYHGTTSEYDITASPVEKYSAGITTFTLKSMNIFSVDDYDTAINDSIYSFIISSLLGFATKDLIGLNIWSGTDNYGVSGFQATVRPFKNLQVAYSYLTDQKYNRNIIKLNYGYKKYSNIAFKTMNTFSEHHINTTLGIEWQFYF